MYTAILRRYADFICLILITAPFCFFLYYYYFAVHFYSTRYIDACDTYPICQHSPIFILLKFKIMLLPRLWIHKWRKSDLLLFDGRNKTVYFYIVYENFYSFKRKQEYNFIFVYYTRMSAWRSFKARWVVGFPK